MSFCRWNWPTTFWLAASLSWMPLLGIVAANLHASPGLVEVLRLTLAFTGLLALIPRRLRSTSPIPENA